MGLRVLDTCLAGCDQLSVAWQQPLAVRQCAVTGNELIEQRDVD